jgi:hypothetical protein
MDGTRHYFSGDKCLHRESPKSHMSRGCSNNNTLTALGLAVIIIIIVVYPVFTEMDKELQASSTV